MIEIKYRADFCLLLQYFGLDGNAAEIGVAEGRNSQVLISCKHIHTLYMIDSWTHLEQAGDGGHPQEWHDNNFREAVERTRYYFDKAIWLKGMSTDMIQRIPDDSLVLGYVDADHSFWGCSRDLASIYPKIKSGGILAGHDYLNLSYGVNAAVDVFIAEHGYSKNDIHLTEENGDTSMVSFWLIKK